MSYPPNFSPPRASRTASTMARRLLSQPTTARLGVGQCARRHQRLHFHQQGPRALDPREDGRPRGALVAAGDEERRRVGDLREPRTRHLEDADLIGRSEAVLRGAQNAEVMRPIAFEGDDRVHHMLDHPGTGDRAVLGHMADEDHGRAGGLRVADQGLGGGPHLRHGAGCRIRPARTTSSGSNR